jgi:hypothetical protein
LDNNIKNKNCFIDKIEISRPSDQDKRNRTHYYEIKSQVYESPRSMTEQLEEKTKDLQKNCSIKLDVIGFNALKDYLETPKAQNITRELSCPDTSLKKTPTKKRKLNSKSHANSNPKLKKGNSDENNESISNIETGIVGINSSDTIVESEIEEKLVEEVNFVNSNHNNKMNKNSEVQDSTAKSNARENANKNLENSTGNKYMFRKTSKNTMQNSKPNREYNQNQTKFGPIFIRMPSKEYFNSQEYKLHMESYMKYNYISISKDRNGNLLIFPSTEDDAVGIMIDENLFPGQEKKNISSENNTIIIKNMSYDQIKENKNLIVELRKIGIIDMSLVSKNHKTDLRPVKVYCRDIETRNKYLNNNITINTNELNVVLITAPNCKPVY